MKIVTEISEWQLLRHEIKNDSLGFVPTMGNLHLGHMSLCQRAQAETKHVVVSIFVNATQFNQAEDYQLYPRTLDSDIALLKQHNIDYLLLFKEKDLYHDNYQIQIHETDLSTQLEGEYRSGHFTGMLTIVLKLLNLVQPSHAYFGEKDYQQLLLIKKMVNSLFLPINIVGCPIVRDVDGVALSSRNSRLTPHHRQKVALFAHILQTGISINEIKHRLEEENIKTDYVVDQWNRRLAAIWLEDVRLIDNIPLR